MFGDDDWSWGQGGECDAEPYERDLEYEDDGVAVWCTLDCAYQLIRGTDSSTKICSRCGGGWEGTLTWFCSCETVCRDCYQGMKEDQMYQSGLAVEEEQVQSWSQQEAVVVEEIKRHPKPQFQWGNGFDTSQGDCQDWPLNRCHVKPIDIARRSLITSVGMRMSENPSRGLKLKIAVFSCAKPSANVCSIGKILARVRECVQFTGSTEAGINTFPLERSVSLAPGRYYLLMCAGGTPANYCFDKCDRPGTNCYYSQVTFDEVLNPGYSLPTLWNSSQVCMSWWLNGECEVHLRKNYTSFVEQLEHHLTPKQDKTYAPPFPDGWNDEEIKQCVLSVACELGSSRVVEYMLAEDQRLASNLFAGASPLMVSAAHGHTSIVQLLLERQVDVAVLSELDCPMGGLRDALMFGCCGVGGKASAEVVRLLLDHKASVDAVDENKRSCLHLASSAQNSEEVVSLLLQKKADIALVDKFGETPLLCACSQNRRAIVQLLLSAGANLNTTDQSGRTGLHIACHYGATTVVQTLLEARATSQVDLKDTNGQTPLLIAAARNDSEISSLLKNAYAELGYSVSWGLTAGDGARHHIETNKLSFIRIAVAVDSKASHVGICFFDNAEWTGDGKVRVGVFADKDAFPDVSELLASGEGRIGVDCKGKESLFALDKDVMLERGKSYWAAFVCDRLTVVAKDASVKEKHRVYLQCASLESCWADAKLNSPKKHQCSLALFIRTRPTNSDEGDEKRTVSVHVGS